MMTVFLFLTMILFQVPQQVQTPRALTNSDIVSMTKSGISADTTVLMIQKSSNCAFDTSPDALIELKKNGVPDTVMTAMISCNKVEVVAAPQDCAKALDAVLDGIGPRETLLSIHSVRWSTLENVTSSRMETYTSDRIRVYPSEFYLERKNEERDLKLIITPEFSYALLNGKLRPVPPDLVSRDMLAQKFEPIYIAQHREEYSCVALEPEPIGGIHTVRFKVSNGHDESIWSVDEKTNQLVKSITGAITLEFSDWRKVGDVSAPFFIGARRETVSSNPPCSVMR